MTVFLDYIEKSANRECPGGLYGCIDKSTNDIDCQDRIGYFLEKNALSNQSNNTRISSIIFIFLLSFIQISNIYFFSLNLSI